MPFNTGAFINNIWGFVLDKLTVLPVLLIALPVHELAHGFIAYMLGDDTAKRSGRLSFNPFRHLDVLGALCIFFLGFGWAKPVPVNPYNFRNRKADMALTAIAGLLANLLMAFLALAIFAFAGQHAATNTVGYNLAALFVSNFAFINIGLCIFNLIPLPPLDGSRLLALILPENALSSFERYGIVPLLLIVFVFWRFISGPISNLTNNIFYAFTNFLHL